MGFATMALIGTGLSAAGQIAGGYGADAAGRANAKNRETQAGQVETQTAANVAAHRRSFDKFRGAQAADIAALGGSAKTGTGLMLAQEAARAAKLDELNMITEGTNQARSLRAGAAMDRFEGKVARTNGFLGGLGTALKGWGDYRAMVA